MMIKLGYLLVGQKIGSLDTSRSVHKKEKLGKKRYMLKLVFII